MSNTVAHITIGNNALAVNAEFDSENFTTLIYLSGFAQGEKGEKGDKGETGEQGESAFVSYLAITDDDPPLSEADYFRGRPYPLIVTDVDEVELSAFNYYECGEREILTITLNSTSTAVAEEFIFNFTSGAIATTLTLPSTILFPSDFEISSNKKYEISIVRDMLIYNEVDA